MGNDLFQVFIYVSSRQGGAAVRAVSVSVSVQTLKPEMSPQKLRFMG